MRDSVDAKGSEEAIEKVLTGLRDAEAPSGMERRILERLEGRVSLVETRPRWRRLVPAWVTMPVATKALVCGAALTGVVAAVLVVPAIRRLEHSTEQSNAGVLPGAAVRTTPATTAGVAEPSAIGRRVKQGTMVKASDAGLVRVADDSKASTEDDVARSDMEAASFPAPPMPLTAQERMLLRLANKVDPVEVAMLDPKFRVTRDAEEKVEFQRFFGQTPVKLADPTQPAGESTADQSVHPSATNQGATVQAPTHGVAPATDQTMPTTQDQPIQKQATPEHSSPDQSTTQQPTAGPIRTAEKE